MNELVSVIVPVYNVERYLNRCLDSIISQSYDNIEIILIDDGSTDLSGKICDQYKLKDSRVITIHKSNGGLSDARNTGLSVAKGNYYIFVDSDDYISKDHIECLYRNLLNYQADISIANLLCVDTDGHPVGTEKKEDKRISTFNKKMAIKELLVSGCFSNSSSGKMFKSELFANVRFPKGRIYEDVATIYKAFLNANKVVYINQNIYYYVYHGESISHKPFNLQKLDLIEFTEKMAKDILQIYPDLESEALLRLYDGFVLLLAECNDDNVSQELLEKIKQMRKRIIVSRQSGFKRKICAISTFAGAWFIKWKIK